MTRIILAAIAMIGITLSSASLADDCNWWQSKLNSAERKLNREGNQSQVKQWQKERHYYAAQLEKCNKSSGNHRWIETTGTASRHADDYTYESPRPVNTDNPQLQQVIKTCNFWIQQYNQSPNSDNRTMKSTACRHADNMTNAPSQTAKPHDDFKPTRPLKECVKPNNVVDNDVKLCMQGLKDPKWATAKN